MMPHLVQRVRLPVRLSTLLLVVSMVWFYIEAPAMAAPASAGVVPIIVSGLEWQFAAITQNWYTLVPAVPFLFAHATPPPRI